MLGEDSECGEDEAVHSIHFSPYGLHVAVCKGNNTLVYDIKVSERGQRGSEAGGRVCGL